MGPCGDLDPREEPVSGLQYMVRADFVLTTAEMDMVTRWIRKFRRDFEGRGPGVSNCVIYVEATIAGRLHWTPKGAVSVSVERRDG